MQALCFARVNLAGFGFVTWRIKDAQQPLAALFAAMSVLPLEEALRASLVSGVVITSVAQCIEELVYNSIDAGASCIAVRVDIPALKVQVIDNGVGIAFEDIKLVGNRNATSKSSAISKSSYGRKGAALSSIAAVAGTLEITTRHKLSVKTFTKVFHLGKEGPVVESDLSRPSAGSTMTVHDLFYNLPVRRKSVCESIVLVKVTQAVSAIALLHPLISFSLRNNQTGDCLLQTGRASSVQHTFAHLFGNDCSLSLKSISVSCNGFDISGHISTDGHANSSLQFLYLNGRLIHKTQLHTFLNSLLTKFLFSNSQQHYTSSQDTDIVLQEKHGVYVIDIRCPFSKYDICHEPSKTLIEFIDWTHVHNALQLLIETFLQQNNLAARLPEMTSQCPKELSNATSRPVLDSWNITSSGRQSRTVRRCSTSSNEISSYTISPGQKLASCSSASMHLSQSRPSLVPSSAQRSCEDISLVGINDDRATISLQERCMDSSLLCATAVRCKKRSISQSSGPATKFSKLTGSAHVPKQASPLLFSQIGSRLSSLHCSSDLSHIRTPNSVSATPHNTQLTNNDNGTLPTSFMKKSKTTSSTPLMDSSMFITPFTPAQPASPSKPQSSQIPSLSKLTIGLAESPLTADKENCSGSENKCPCSKPEIPAPVHTNKSYQSVKEILSSWENPAFRANDRELLGATGYTKVHNNLFSYKFTNTVLKDVKVLGQVDDKFIACLLKMNHSADHHLLVVFDQHAVHERIRLETFTRDAYEKDGTSEKHVLRLSQCSPLPIALQSTERQLARLFSSRLMDIGVKLVYDGDRILVTTLPTVLIKDLATSTNTVRAEPIQKMIVSHLEFLQATNGGSTALPQALQHVLASQACHGAIKFGDHLSLSECEELVHSLSNCQLPFQCAHGRPSLVPLIDLATPDNKPLCSSIL